MRTRQSVNFGLRTGFTLTEILVSMAVGLVIIQIAFSSFLIVQKYVNRIQRLEAANQVLQSAVIWYIQRRADSSFPPFPTELIGPALPAKVGSVVPRLADDSVVRRMPYRIMVGRYNTSSGTSIDVYDYSEEARDAYELGDTIGITGWSSATPDPRILAEIQLP